MKSMWLGVLVAFAGGAFASTPLVRTAEYYVLETWQGEYPTGYQLLDDVSVYSVQSPENPATGESCTLKKNSVIHPWAKKTQSEFLTLSPVSHYKAKKDFEIEVYQGKPVQVKAGTEILNLSYLAEGICRMSVNGEVVEDSCFSNDDERAELLSESAFGTRAFFRTACKEGYEAWIDSLQLETLLQEDEPRSLKHAEVIDYGTVEEP